MKQLFLSSLFADVAGTFAQFAREPLTGKTVTFIPTASVPETVTFYVKAARTAFTKMGIVVDELDVSTAPKDEAMRKLRDNDYIYVSGGNVFYLLQELRRTGVDKMIVEEIRGGKPYIGESAGSVILSPNIEYAKIIDDPAAAPDLTDYTGLGAVDFHTLPHYGNFPFKEAGERIMREYQDKIALRPITNSEFIEVYGASVTVTHGKKLDRFSAAKSVMSFLIQTSCMKKRMCKPPIS